MYGHATKLHLMVWQQTVFQQNLVDFLARIDEFDQQLRVALKDKEEMKFMVFHPSWVYFADTYGLEQVAIEIEGKNPKPAQLQQLIEKCKGRGGESYFCPAAIFDQECRNTRPGNRGISGLDRPTCRRLAY